MNHEAFNTFWYWIGERYSIFQKKENGDTKPWSEDSIFQTWKFCNVFRTDDKQTRWLITNVITPHVKESLALTLFNIFAFRAFNWYETYDLLRNSQTGWISSWNENTAKRLLLAQKLHGDQLTSGAYMIRGVQGIPKYESIPQALSHIWNMREYMAERIQDEPIETLEGLQELLRAMKFYGWGPFTCYQVVLDMTYTRFFENAPDINEWCAFGPGAKRGIQQIWPDARRETEMLHYAKRLFLEQYTFRPEWVPAMTLQDIEFCLCELSKYRRIQAGGKSKEKYDGKPSFAELRSHDRTTPEAS